MAFPEVHITVTVRKWTESSLVVHQQNKCSVMSAVRFYYSTEYFTHINLLFVASKLPSQITAAGKVAKPQGGSIGGKLSYIMFIMWHEIPQPMYLLLSSGTNLIKEKTRYLPILDAIYVTIFF